MIAGQHLAEVISFFAGVAMLAAMVRLLHQQSVDSVRSELFALRDEMFLYAVDHQLLENEAYRDLRAQMNGFIRYAHEFTAMRVVGHLIVCDLFKVPTKSRWPHLAERIKALGQDDRVRMEKFYEDQRLIISFYLVDRSLILKTLLRLHIIYSGLRGLSYDEPITGDPVIRRVARRVPWGSVEAEAACA